MRLSPATAGNEAGGRREERPRRKPQRVRPLPPEASEDADAEEEELGVTEAKAAKLKRIMASETAGRKAVTQLRDRMHAPKTKRVHNAAWAWYEKLCAARGWGHLPLTVLKLEWYVACLVAAGYQAACVYLSGVLVSALLAGYPLDPSAYL